MKSAAFLFLVLGFVLGGCAGGDGVEHPDVVVICLDTLRADRVGAYGRTPTITPTLDGFAATATVYEHAWATAPWTLPSHASMFTGQYAFEHGAHTVSLDAIGNGVADDSNNVVPLTDRALTLAERLHIAGYRTGAIVANEAYVTPRYGMDQGFEHFDVEMRDAPAINAAAAAWLRERDDRPVFLFLNYMDAHRPYNLTPRTGFVQPESPREGVRLLNELYGPVLAGEGDPDRLERLAALYDLAVANLDDGLGEFLALLRSQAIFDDALIVILSDHGEYLGEHDLIEHSKDVHEPVLRIPFLVKAPGQREALAEPAMTSLVHLPWIVARHTRAFDAEGFPYVWPADAVVAENHFTRIKDLRSPWADRFQRSRHVLIDWPWKWIASSDGDDALYDLVADPAESDNLVGANARADSLRARLQSRLDAPRATFEKLTEAALPELSPEEIERLRSLGYF